MSGTIAAVRVARGLSIDQLASRLDVGVDRTRRLEHNVVRDHRILTLTRLAVALDVSVVVFARAYSAAAVAPIGPDCAAPRRAALPDPTIAARRMGLVARQARTERSVTLVEFGDRSGVNHVYLGAIERGEIASPTLATLNRISHGVPTHERPDLLAALVRAYAGETAP